MRKKCPYLRTRITPKTDTFYTVTHNNVTNVRGTITCLNHIKFGELAWKTYQPDIQLLLLNPENYNDTTV